MSDPYRWTLDEYVLRCEDGAGLAEILSEGSLDRAVFTQAVRRWGHNGVGVLDVSTVAVTPSELAEASLCGGAKSELIAIALRLEARAQLTTIQAKVAIVVDRDYDDVDKLSRFLFQTDGHSMESYALNLETLDQFVTVGLAWMPDDPNESPGEAFLRRIIQPITEIGAVRIVLSDLEPPLSPFAGWLGDVHVGPDGGMQLDGLDHMKRVMEQKARSSEFVSTEARRAAVLSDVVEDPERWVRGHDFVSVAHKLLRSTWGRRTLHAEVKAWSEANVCRLLMMAVPAESLDRSSLFVDVRAQF